ncbi:MAG: restriction endonuclease subunit S [Treponema sp.]|nr:restriction endonuclease subunit S [Treponema sp.]
MAKKVDLPEPIIPNNSWKIVELGKYVKILNGYPFDSGRFTNSSENTYPLIRIRDVVRGYTETFTDEDCPDEYKIKKDEILIGMDGDFNISRWKSDFGLLNQRVCKIETSSKDLDEKFLYYYLPITLKQINDATPSVTVKHLSSNSLQQLHFPLPPLVEQQRIVNRIEAMFAKLDQAQEKAQAVLDSFETRKAAILHKAFTGELTANWRKENGIGNNTELDSIYSFVQSLTKKDITNIAEFQSQATDYILSDGTLWKKCCIGAIGIVTNGSTPSRKEPSFWNGDIPWVSSGEVSNNIIEATNECITEEGYNNSSVKKLPIGTVLIAMIGEGKTRGQTSVLNIEATTNQNIAAIIINHGHVEPRFLWYWLQKEYKNNRTAGNGSGPQALNCQRVRELPFVLPSLHEQQEIVRILDTVLEKESRAKEAAQTVLDQITLLKKSILSRAFRGEF